MKTEAQRKKWGQRMRVGRMGKKAQLDNGCPNCGGLTRSIDNITLERVQIVCDQCLECFDAMSGKQVESLPYSGWIPCAP